MPVPCACWRRARLHVSPGRDRQAGTGALAVLSGKSDVLEARCGSGSILLLLTPDADLGGICRDLEAALPELCRPAKACRGARSGASANGPAGGPMTVLSGLLRRGQTVSLGLSPRKLNCALCWPPAAGHRHLASRVTGAPIWWPGRPSACWPRVASGPGARPCSISALARGCRLAAVRIHDGFCGSEKGRQMPTLLELRSSMRDSYAPAGAASLASGAGSSPAGVAVSCWPWRRFWWPMMMASSTWGSARAVVSPISS